MKAAGAKSLVVRMSYVLALMAASFLLMTGAALAEAVVHSKGGPGQAANAGGAGSWFEIAATLIVLAAVAAVILYESARLRERESVSLEEAATVHVGRTQRPTAA